jgi:hypothetical protein
MMSVGLRSRVHAWLHEEALDAELSSGADPTATVALSLRAGQLRRARPRLVRSLRSAIEVAERQPSLHQLVRGDEVRSCRELLCELADRLEEAKYPSVAALAGTHRLLTDGASPLYSDGPRGSLAATLATALEELGRD